MLYIPTTQFLAATAQQRHIDGTRFDGPVESDRRRWRSFTAAVFSRAAAGPRSSRRPLATLRPSSI